MRALLSSRSLALRTYDRALRCPKRLWSPGGTVNNSLSTTSRTLAKANTSSSLGKLAGLDDILKVSEEVKDALATNKPVVALESTIYTHGAIDDLGLEDIVRQHGGVPAVVGIYDGVPTVGLLPDEVTRMVEGSAKKVSRRDIAHLVGMVRLLLNTLPSVKVIPTIRKYSDGSTGHYGT